MGRCVARVERRSKPKRLGTRLGKHVHIYSSKLPCIFANSAREFTRLNSGKKHINPGTELGRLHAIRIVVLHEYTHKQALTKGQER